MAVVTPFLKKPTMDTEENWKKLPSCVQQNILSKLFERIIARQLNGYLSENFSYEWGHQWFVVDNHRINTLSWTPRYCLEVVHVLPSWPKTECEGYPCLVNAVALEYGMPQVLVLGPILLLFYTTLLSDVISSFCVDHVLLCWWYPESQRNISSCLCNLQECLLAVKSSIEQQLTEIKSR